MVALWSPVVSGSNPASFRVDNSEDRQSHYEYCNILGIEGKLPLTQKKENDFFYIPERSIKAVVVVAPV